MIKTDTLTKIVYAVLVYLVLFSIVMTMIFIYVGSVPDSLIQWVFTTFGVELMMTMTKKILDKKYGRDSNDETGFISEIDK